MSGEFPSVIGFRNLTVATEHYGAIPTPAAVGMTPLSVNFNDLRVALGSSDGGQTLPLAKLFSPDGHLTPHGVAFLTQRAGFPSSGTHGITVSTTAHDLGAMTLTDDAPGIQGTIVDLAKIAEYSATHGGSYTGITLANVQTFNGNQLAGAEGEAYFTDLTGLVVGVCKEDTSCTNITSIHEAQLAAAQRRVEQAENAATQLVQGIGREVATPTCDASSTITSNTCVADIGTLKGSRDRALSNLHDERTPGRTITITGSDGRTSTRPSLASIVQDPPWTLQDAAQVGVDVLTVALLGKAGWNFLKGNKSRSIFDPRIRPYQLNLERKVSARLQRLAAQKNEVGIKDHPTLSVRKDAPALVNAIMLEWHGVARDEANKTETMLSVKVGGTDTTYALEGGEVSEEGFKALLTAVGNGSVYPERVRDHARLVLASFNRPARSDAADISQELGRGRSKIVLDKPKLAALLKSIKGDYDDADYRKDAEELERRLNKKEFNVKSKIEQGVLTEDQLFELLTAAEANLANFDNMQWPEYLEVLKHKRNNSGSHHSHSSSVGPTAEDKAKKVLSEYITPAYEDIKATPELKGFTIENIVEDLWSYASGKNLMASTEAGYPSTVVSGYIKDGGVENLKIALKKIRTQISKRKTASI